MAGDTRWRGFEASPLFFVVIYRISHQSSTAAGHCDRTMLSQKRHELTFQLHR